MSTPVTSPERVPTPLISLDPVFLTAGASNATAANQAGATNSTAGQDLSAAPIFATQAWYGPATPNSEVQAETENTDFFPSMSTPELGIAQFEPEPLIHLGGPLQGLGFNRPHGARRPLYG